MSALVLLAFVALADPGEDACRADPAAAPPVASGCEDVRPLERPALLGLLTPEQVACLAGRAAEGPQRIVPSLLLLTHYAARGERAAWEAQAERHLQLDRSDPDLLYRYAKQVLASRPTVAFAHADEALMLAPSWEEPKRSSRTFELYKIRADAARRLWRAAEGAELEPARMQVHAAARDWLGSAVSLGREGESARALCLLTAVDGADCEVCDP